MFNETQHRINQALLNLPRQMGIEIVAFSKRQFLLQGWQGEGFDPWAARNKKAKNNVGRAILIGPGSGHLRNSIRIISTTSQGVTVGSDLPYAKIHNEGFNDDESVRAHTRKLFTKVKGKAYNLKTKKERNVTTKLHTGNKDIDTFTRHMKMPKRQYLPTDKFPSKTLDDQLCAIIEKELLKALNG